MTGSHPFWRKWGGNMRKSILLARSNLRRAKGQAAAIAVLIFLAAFMLNLWLMLSIDYKQNFERCHDRLHAEHVTFAADQDSGDMHDFLTETFEEDKRTKESFMDSCMHMVSIFDYNGGEINSEFVFLEKEAALSRPIGRAEIVEEGNYTSGIYMPVLYKSDEIEIGNTIDISIGGGRVSYTVCGFFNSAMAGSHNCSMCELILTEDKYKELMDLGYAPQAVLCSVRLKDKAESEDYEAMLKNAVSLRYPDVRTVSNSYALVSVSRYVSQTICSGVVSAMAFFILLIALVVIASNIINYIQENMKDLGALKAVGYTGHQLMSSLLFQFLGLSLIFCTAGALASYILFPALNAMMVAQTGIPYRIRFLPIPFALTLAILDGAVFLTVWLSSRRIKRIEPIIALRQGLKTHNFKRNHVPLERTRMPLHFALALKTTLSGIKNNVIVCITMLVLSLVVVFSGLMLENMIADMAPFIHLIVGETADSCVNVRVEEEEDFLKKMEEDARVEKIYLYNSVEVRHVGGIGLMATVCDDFSKVNNQDGVIDGRFPRYDNEIAVAAKYAGERNLEIGDEIRITADGKEAAYIISGFTQTTNNLGKDCLLTREGYERLGSFANVSYYMNLSEETDIEEFHSEIKESFKNAVNAVINIDEVITGASSVYVSLMKMIVAAVLILSVVIIAFVLYLLVRTTLNNKKKDYGILKALGFTTGQLVLQTALSFMPAVIFSAAVGMTICSFIINPLTAVFLRNMGIVKCTFTVPVLFNILAGAGLVLAAFLIACLLSVKIRRITPKELVAGE